MPYDSVELVLLAHQIDGPVWQLQNRLWAEAILNPLLAFPIVIFKYQLLDRGLRSGTKIGKCCGLTSHDDR